jgi:hypothetical protein
VLITSLPSTVLVKSLLIAYTTVKPRMKRNAYTRYNCVGGGGGLMGLLEHSRQTTGYHSSPVYYLCLS